MKFFCTAIFLFNFYSFLAAQLIQEVQDLDLSYIQQIYGAPLVNKSVTGEKIMVNGKVYQKGFGAHSTSKLKIKMYDGSRFSALVGVNDNKINYKDHQVRTIPLTDGKRVFYKITHSQKQFVGVEGEEGHIDKGSVVFKVMHNGEEVFNSGVMKQGDDPKKIDLETKGGILELIVEDAGDGSSGDHAVWIQPEIEYLEIAPATTAYDHVGQIQEITDKIQSHLLNQISNLPEMHWPFEKAKMDWLIDNSSFKAVVRKLPSGKDIVLTNGLISRVFRLTPNLATIDFHNHMTNESILRAVSNEGALTIDGRMISIGGLSGQPEFAYTKNDWLDQMNPLPNSFIIEDFEVNELHNKLHWKQIRWAGNRKMPTGKEIIFTLKKDNVKVKVHYALYDGIPILGKWIEVINEGELLVQLNKFKLEQLALVEGENLVNTPEHWEKPNVHFESDYAFGGMNHKTSDHTTYWEKDTRYTSQTNYPLNLPCLLEVRPPLGPEVGVPPGDTFTSFTVWEMAFDSREEERKGLFIRKMYRTIAPWVTENPIFMHLTTTDENIVKKDVDQCAEVGYEMIILSFGSGLNMEDESPENYEKFQRLTNYANSKGIELGGYSLLSSRWISDEVDVINPKTGKRGGMIFGSSPCLASEWGYDYFRKIKKFYAETGMSVFENDGSYPGNVCASEKHAHHNGLGDSQWKQYSQIQNLYQWLRAEGVYMNIPDFYFLSGSNKTGIGYREVNWSLPRARQLILGRQNIYDGLWKRIPSMCWTFTPLTQYHGGGAAATIEPLSEHLDDYKNQMIQNYGSGVQSCYRGPRLYDTEETKQVVKKVVDWYKNYREILNSDIIHLRRPSGKDWDGFIHVNPQLEEKALALFFNPTNEDIRRKIELPLYYSGLQSDATVIDQLGTESQYTLDREYKIEIEVEIPANSYNWVVVKESN